MTAEVAILNQQAVALAADSAVTIGGYNVPKIYPSANKLFTLSKYAPVGVMVYNSASFMGVPWEVIVKTSREHLGQRVFPRLEDYTEHLLHFIESNEAITPRDQEERYTKNLIQHLFEMLRRHVAAQAEKEESPEMQILHGLVEQLHKDWSVKPIFTSRNGATLDKKSIDMVAV